MALRIERLDFRPWGCFEDHSLAFSSRSGDVELVHGRNASGKSTTSRGERGLLYGIGARTPDSHTFDYADLRIGARLNLDGTIIELSRRKRRLGSLTAENGDPLPDDLLLRALSGLTEEVYGAVFQVDNETLVRGGAELLQGKGEVGASLFAAAAGTATLHGTLGEFDAEAERLFNPRGRTSVLHKALAVSKDAEKRLRDSTVRPVRHREMTQRLAEDEQACEALSERIREREVHARVIERKRAIAPLLDARAEYLSELENLAGVPDLPDSSASERSAAQARLRAGEVSLKREAKAARTLDEEIDRFEVDAAIIGRGDEIRAVKDAVSTVGKAAGDRRKREGELQEAKAALKVAAAVAGVDSAEIESLRRPETARRALDRCLSQHDELVARLRAAEVREADALTARGVAQESLDACAVATDVDGLEAAIVAALKLGAIGEQIEQEQLDATLRSREAAERLARLAVGPSSLDALRVLSSPTRLQISRAASQTEVLRRESETLESDWARLAASEAKLAEEREQLLLAGEAPTAEILALARTGRDEQWAAMRALVADGSAPATVDADRFERAIGDADRLADVRVDHAAQIERSATVQARGSGLARERAVLEAREVSLHEDEVAAVRDWAGCWSVTGLAQIDPEDAEPWLDERDAILELGSAALEAEARAEALRARQQAHIEALSAELRELGHAVAVDASLDVLIARGQKALAGVRELITVRAVEETTLLAAARSVRAAERERQNTVAAWLEWETGWPEQRADAGLPPTATSEAAQEIVRAVDDGLGHHDRIADLERRIAGIDGDRAEFDERVRALCQDVASDLLALDGERAAHALSVRLDEQERSRGRLDDLIERRAGISEDLLAVESDIAAAQDEIDHMLAAAGCDHPDQLPEIEIRAARVHVLRKAIAEVEGQVAKIGEGRFAELSNGSADFDRERAAVELEDCRSVVDDLRAERDLLKEGIGEQKRELGRMETDTTAVVAAQDVALARASVVEAATAYTAAKLAATAVRRAIERYRRLHQDPLLRRANLLFTRFTLGSFVELFVDIDEHGDGILIGRQRDRVLKRVPQMSKGTREQLYLALRIAAIERYVATAGAVPVVFDDVFLESDPPRSERIFEALGELATRTQVIVLTHHEHLIEVGRRALRDRLLVQDLPDTAPTLREAAAA